MSLVVVVFLVEELILYAELLDCVWKHCRIHCIRRNLVVLVLSVETPLEDGLKNLGYLLSPLLWK